jgi:centromeric protein E
MTVYEDPVYGVSVKEAKEMVVRSTEDALEILKDGEKNRHFAETGMNARSSRSHTLFKVVLESRKVSQQPSKTSSHGSQECRNTSSELGKQQSKMTKAKRIVGHGGGDVVYALLNLVDLAGSERQSKSCKCCVPCHLLFV